jgi:hypothetical protein
MNETQQIRGERAWYTIGYAYLWPAYAIIVYMLAPVLVCVSHAGKECLCTVTSLSVNTGSHGYTVVEAHGLVFGSEKSHTIYAGQSLADMHTISQTFRLGSAHRCIIPKGEDIVNVFMLDLGMSTGSPVEDTVLFMLLFVLGLSLWLRRVAYAVVEA